MSTIILTAIIFIVCTAIAYRTIKQQKHKACNGSCGCCKDCH